MRGPALALPLGAPFRLASDPPSLIPSLRRADEGTLRAGGNPVIRPPPSALDSFAGSGVPGNPPARKFEKGPPLYRLTPCGRGREHHPSVCGAGCVYLDLRSAAKPTLSLASAKAARQRTPSSLRLWLRSSQLPVDSAGLRWFYVVSAGRRLHRTRLPSTAFQRRRCGIR